MGVRVERGDPIPSGYAPAERRAWPAADSWLRRPAAAVIALMLGAAVLRFATLDVQSIWLDESATMVLVRRGLVGHALAPALERVGAAAVLRARMGLDAAVRRRAARLPRLLCARRSADRPGPLRGRAAFSPRIGLWAAALAAVNPAMYYYSQEARAYALVVLLSAAALVLWQRALERSDRRSLWLWSGMSILAVLTHYFAAFLFLAEAVVLARRRGFRPTLAPVGAVLLVGIALLPLALRQRADGKSNWIEGASLASRIAESAKQFLVGLYGPLEVLAALLAALLAAGAVALLLRYGDRRERASARDMAIVAGTAIALPLLLAASRLVDVYDGRNIIAVWAPCAVVVAIGLGVARAPRAGAALGAGLCAVSLGVIAATNALPAYQRDDWRGAAHALPAHARERVIVGPRNSALPLSIYLPATREAAGRYVAARELDFVALRRRRTGRSPAAPAVPTRAPAGFRLVQAPPDRKLRRRPFRVRAHDEGAGGGPAPHQRRA